MRQQIIYPNERTAITNVMAKSMADQQPDIQSLSLQGMLDNIIHQKDLRKSPSESLVKIHRLRQHSGRPDWNHGFVQRSKVSDQYSFPWKDLVRPLRAQWLFDGNVMG